MEQLKIEAGDKSPEILLDASQGIVKISGISDEQDALATYFPVLQWLDSYVAHPQQHTRVALDFKYYNTASAKSLFEVLKRVSKLQHGGRSVEVNWYYEQGDENMQDEIDNFSDIAHIPIKAIEKQS